MSSEPVPAEPSRAPDPLPATAEQLEAELRLLLTAGVGPRLRQALIDQFGTAVEVWNAAPSQWRATPGIGPKLVRQLQAARDQADVEGELAACRELGLRVLLHSDPAYPAALRTLPDAPGVLFVRGEIRPSDALGVALVGARHATHYGLAIAERLAGSLTRAGLVVISGLARGIDAQAHRAALEAGGRTLAVLGGGLAEIYPPEHRQLADQVAAAGALISETPPRMQPLSGMFPQRNRLISGLSLGVVVIEAAVRSGALITARHAMEQGREVFAVPGRVDSAVSRGCHRLIRDGATLVETADDVLEQLGPLVAAATSRQGRTIHHPAELLLNEVETQVLEHIACDPVPIEQVAEKSGLPLPRVLATLSVLEIRRLVRRVSGQLVVRV